MGILRSRYNNYSKHMNFPSKEYLDLKLRLSGGKDIITTRVSSEYEKFKDDAIGTRYLTDLGYILELKKKNQFSSIKEHPYYTELTNEWINQINKYPKYIVLTLFPFERIKHE